MEGVAAIVVVVIFLALMYILLRPGVILHLDSNQRYEQMLRNINENHDLGFISQQERLILINDLSPNAVRMFFIRRKLQKFVKSRNIEYARNNIEIDIKPSIEIQKGDEIKQKINN